jgi:hypothetical protein
MFKENPDFYPTPIQLIQKMLNKIDYRCIKTVLEPSAGRGDLVESITRKFESYQGRYNHNKKYDIDVVEFDQNLQYILKGKQLRLVHDDFLSYNTFKRYDVIIMNPPYSQGDKHLLKAIEMQQEGGKIVCLLNAETLKNPYTNTRKDLVRQLEKYNAEVEYLENAFSEAERKTNVETALIYINIPKIDHNSLVVESLKQDESHKIKDVHQCQALINSDFITGIVEQYNYEVKAGLKLINEYNSLRPLMLRSFKDDDTPVLKLGLEYEDKDGSNLENAYIKQIGVLYLVMISLWDYSQVI